MTLVKKDIYQTVTDQIIKALQQDQQQPQMPWQRTGFQNELPRNASTQNSYQGINILSLWASALVNQFPKGLWATYRQWQSLDCQVIKGSKATTVIFYKEYELDPDTTVDPSTGQTLTALGDTGLRRVAKASPVFNVAQVDGYIDPTPEPERPPLERLYKADDLVNRSKAVVCHGGERAYYDSKRDQIQMPDDHLFIGTDTSNRQQSYYAVLMHELTHWSGHKSRLDRVFGKRFGDDAYAMEELVAELGAAFLCAELQITPETRPDHAHYIHAWLDVMKADNRAVFAAASKAQEAVRYLQRLK